MLVRVRCALGHARSRRWRVDVREGVGATGDSLVARLAVPDTGGVTLDRVLAAEGAGVAGVLRDFNLLHLLTERGTITEGFTLECCPRPRGSVERVRGCVRTGYRIYR